MFRHTVRHIIQPGSFAEYVTAVKAFNTAATAAGLPAYRLWHTLFGDLNEVWAEADYDSLDAHVAAWERAESEDTLMRAFRDMVALTVPGSVHDYPLAPVTPQP